MTYVLNYKPFFLLSFSVIFLEQLFSNSSGFSVLVFAIILLIGGLPHGALDFYILKNIFKMKSFVFSLSIYYLLVSSMALSY